MGFVERHVTEKTKPLVEPVSGSPIVVSHASGMLGGLHVCEQGRMVAFFDPKI